jgi:CRISPR-associated protein Csx10
MKVLSYRIHLKQPVLVPRLESEANSAETLDYLPGSVLRGAVLHKYIKRNNLDIDAGDQTIRRLFFSGETRYLNAYLQDRVGTRGLPTPLSWHGRKWEEDSEIRDLVVAPLTEDDQDTWRRTPIAYFTLQRDDLTVRPLRVDTLINVHTERDAVLGRATEESGEVFRYEPLAPGQVFRAAVLCQCDQDAVVLQDVLAGETALGGSRTAGYGRVRLELIDIADARAWREVDGNLNCDGDSLRVLLLSDTLLRDGNGQCAVSTAVMTAELERLLETKLTPKGAFFQVSAVGGFNRTWGLPIPQAQAFGMGSVFAYEMVVNGIRPGVLAKIELEGIGDRPAEGFGRVAINWAEEDEWLIEDWPDRKDDISSVAIASQLGRDLAAKMAKRLLRQRIEDRILAMAVGSEKYRIEHAPPNAQVSRLRSVVRDALLSEQPALDGVTGFLDALHGKALNHFKSALVDNQDLKTWLSDICQKTDLDAWSQMFGISTDDNPRIGTVTADLDDGLRREYLLRFIDAVLARAVERRRKEEAS